MTSLPSSVPTETRTELPERLRALEDTLQHQLEGAVQADDHVAVAHRAAVEQNLEEVRLALRLHDEGRYGRCIRCADPISVGRLEARPWATRCVRCAERFGW